MAKTQGWHRVMTGWYQYTNAAGSVLAEAKRYRSFWNVTVIPGGEAARTVELRESPGTLREAKALAEVSLPTKATTPTATLTPAQERALDAIRQADDGELFIFSGVSTATIRVLERLGLVDVKWETTHVETSRGYRGVWTKRPQLEWVARLRPGVRVP